MYFIPELLAPAGGPEQLKAAVENGADAVYLGGPLFNARMNADNFTADTMKEGVEYAHMRGCAVHVTMNTLLRDQELAGAVEQAAWMYQLGADAFIVQDLGLASLLLENFPEMTLHLSTQGTVYSAEGARKAGELGFSRVVLAREAPLEEIRRAAELSGVEIEVFVHGALCMCYSGQCQMSRIIGGRSGNRGACAQPCRLNYEICGKDGKTLGSPGYLLSPKDICTVDHLGDLAAAGVRSLKIEGRMKSPEYVAVVTAIYRRYLDQYRRQGEYRVAPEDRLALNQIFNRGAFSAGYLLGNPGTSLLSGPLAKHQGVPIGTVASCNPGRKTIQAKFDAPQGGQAGPPLSLGDGIEIRNRELSGNVVTYMKGREIGYLTGSISPGDRIYKITDKALMERARKTYQGKSGEARKELRRRAVSMEFTARPGEPMRLKVWDAAGAPVGPEALEGGVVSAAAAAAAEDRPGSAAGVGAGAGERPGSASSGDAAQLIGAAAAAEDRPGSAAEVLCVEVRSEAFPEQAVNRATEEASIRKQLEKTGDTPFRVEALTVNMEPGLSLRLSDLNGLRRRALEQLEGEWRKSREEARRIEPERLNAALEMARSGRICGAALGAEKAGSEWVPAAGRQDTAFAAGRQDTAFAAGRPWETSASGSARIGDAAGCRISYYLFSPGKEALELARTATVILPETGAKPAFASGGGLGSGAVAGCGGSGVGSGFAAGCGGSGTGSGFAAGVGSPVPVSRYYLPYELFLDPRFRESLEALREAGKETVPFLPPVTGPGEDKFIKKNLDKLAEAAAPFGISLGNLAHIKLLEGSGAKIYGDYGLNLYNRFALDLAGELGLAGVVLSNEFLRSGAGKSSGEDLQALKEQAEVAAAGEAAGLPTEIPAGGEIPLMISAHCAAGDMGKGCRKRSEGGGAGICEKGEYCLKDRKGKLYPILPRKRDCQMILFSEFIKMLSAIHPMQNAHFCASEEPQQKNRGDSSYRIENDREFINEVRPKGGLNLRFYGIDKKLFCGRSET